MSYFIDEAIKEFVLENYKDECIEQAKRSKDYDQFITRINLLVHDLVTDNKDSICGAIAVAALDDTGWDDIAEPFWIDYQESVGGFPERKFKVGEVVKTTTTDNKFQAKILNCKPKATRAGIYWMYHLDRAGWWGEDVLVGVEK